MQTLPSIPPKRGKKVSIVNACVSVRGRLTDAEFGGLVAYLSAQASDLRKSRRAQSGANRRFPERSPPSESLRRARCRARTRNRRPRLTARSPCVALTRGRRFAPLTRKGPAIGI